MLSVGCTFMSMGVKGEVVAVEDWVVRVELDGG